MLYDVGIIGGGISGIGVAYEASKLGLKSVLLEKDDLFCPPSSASSNSLRIIHGGFRYFQKLQFSRLVESIQSKHELENSFPTLIKKLPCLLPIEKLLGLISPITVKSATTVYNLLSLFLIGESNGASFVNQKSLTRIAPLLSAFGKYGACLWYDAQLTSLKQFTALLIAESEKRGAKFHSGEEVKGIEGQNAQTLSGSIFNARVWIDTTGAFSFCSDNQKVCVGYNLIYKGSLECEYALAVPGPGRFYFISPRENEIAVGTWYKEGFEPPSEDEISNAIDEFSSTLPDDSRFKKSNLLRIEAAPLTASNGATPKDIRSISQNGNLIRVNSTKFTTFLPQAREALKYAAEILKD